MDNPTTDSLTVKEAIEQGNRMIAEFDGWKHSKSGKTVRRGTYDSPFRLKDLHYNSSWDWLCRVVEKIEGLENSRFGFTIDPWGVQIIDYANKEMVIVEITRDDNQVRFCLLYDAVTDFVKWYNSQSK